jgi:hypothetical protein
VRKESEGMNGCIVTEVLLYVKCSNATGLLNTVLRHFIFQSVIRVKIETIGAEETI